MATFDLAAAAVASLTFLQGIHMMVVFALRNVGGQWTVIRNEHGEFNGIRLGQIHKDFFVLICDIVEEPCATRRIERYDERTDRREPGRGELID